MDLIRLLHTMSKIHNVVKPIGVGDIVKFENTNELVKVVEIKTPCPYLAKCPRANPFCKFVEARGWNSGKDGKQGPQFGCCYQSFHRVSKTDRFIYHMQGQFALNEYKRARIPATICDESDGIS